MNIFVFNQKVKFLTHLIKKKQLEQKVLIRRK